MQRWFACGVGHDRPRTRKDSPRAAPSAVLRHGARSGRAGTLAWAERVEGDGSAAVARDAGPACGRDDPGEGRDGGEGGRGTGPRGRGRADATAAREPGRCGFLSHGAGCGRGGRIAAGCDWAGLDRVGVHQRSGGAGPCAAIAAARVDMATRSRVGASRSRAAVGRSAPASGVGNADRRDHRRTPVPGWGAEGCWPHPLCTAARPPARARPAPLHPPRAVALRVIHLSLETHLPPTPPKHSERGQPLRRALRARSAPTCAAATAGGSPAAAPPRRCCRPSRPGPG